MQTSKLCAIAVLMCIITPLIAGYVWPSDVEEHTGYETVDSSIITDQYKNADMPVYGAYRGDLNNRYWPTTGYNLDPYEQETDIAVTSAPAFYLPSGYQNSIVTASQSPGQYNTIKQFYETSVTSTHYSAPDCYAVRISGSGISLDPSQAPDWAETAGDLAVNIMYWYPNFYGVYDSLGTGHNYVIFTNGEVMEADGLRFQILGSAYARAYLPQTRGVIENSLPVEKPLYYISSTPHEIHTGYGNYVWSNSYENSGVDFIVSTSSFQNNVGLTFNFPDIYSITLVRVGDSFYYATPDMADVGEVTARLSTIQAAPYVWLHYNYSGVLEINPLSGLSSWIDPYYAQRAILSQTVKLDVPSGTFDKVLIGFNTNYTLPSQSPYPLVYCASAWIPNGTQRAIEDEFIGGYNYYDGVNWQLSLGSPSTLGDTIQFGYYDVDSQSVIAGAYASSSMSGSNFTIINYAGEEKTYSVRYLEILAIQSADGVYNHRDIYFNGELVFTGVSSYFGVTLGGIWNTVLTMYDVDPYQYDVYNWTAGLFSITLEEFCLIGLATAIFMFIALSLYTRRRSGGLNMMALALTLGIVSVIYIILATGGL